MHSPAATRKQCGCRKGHTHVTGLSVITVRIDLIAEGRGEEEEEEEARGGEEEPHVYNEKNPSNEQGSFFFAAARSGRSLRIPPTKYSASNRDTKSTDNAGVEEEEEEEERRDSSREGKGGELITDAGRKEDSTDKKTFSC